MKEITDMEIDMRYREDRDRGEIDRTHRDEI